MTTHSIECLMWFVDPGHAWLRVPLDMAKRVEGISGYSYVDKREGYAYLEEDCDAGRFITHYGLDKVMDSVPEKVERVSSVRDRKGRYE